MPALSRLLPASAQEALRPLNRLRWIAKAKQVGFYGADWRADPAGIARYVLWDVQVGDFAYDLDNRAEFAAGVAAALGVSPARVEELFAEAEAQPALSTELAATLRRRLDLPSRPMLGPRLGWYALVRETRPRLVVETGIKHGIGSLTLLAALERNAAEGHPGELVSIDASPAAGSIVPPGRFGGWTRIAGFSPDALRPVLEGRTIDVLIHDTPPELDAAEYELGLEHAGEEIWMVSGCNDDRHGALAAAAGAHGAQAIRVAERARHPVYPGTAMVIARVRPGGTPPAGA